MRAQFQAAAEAVGATVKRFASMADAVSHLRELAAGSPVGASRLPADIEAHCAGIAFAGEQDYATARLCLSYAWAGIAETGSLLLDLTDPVGRSASALALIHAVILRESTIASDIYALLDELGQLLRENPHTYLSITTGPSRTADIERVLTIGVHGPKELHILMVGDN
ncbi:MAG TPA: LUD domain-containing protein [Geobacteraceae bacterium]